MTYFIPIRKIVKILWTKREFTRREREPLTLTECVEKNMSETRNVTKHITLVLLFITMMYFTYAAARNMIDNYTNLPRFISSEAAYAATTSEYKNGVKGKDAIPIIPACYLDWKTFGKIEVNKTVKAVLLEKVYPRIQKGGYYHPVECTPRHKVAILVPYRDREANLAVFLYNIHPFLMYQKLEYRIFIIEQKGTETFNKGKLFNAGYLEMKKFGSWLCVILHDVDLLPLDQRILYTCPTWPRHMCGTVASVVSDPTFRTMFGGVASVSPKIFETVNGFSNLYWGWGGEDDDFFWRLRYSGFPVVRYNKSIARYTALPHTPAIPVNRLRYFLLRTTRSRYKKDGLSSLKYKVESVTLHHLYTHMLVDTNPTKENITEVLKKWTAQYNLFQ